MQPTAPPRPLAIVIVVVIAVVIVVVIVVVIFIVAVYEVDCLIVYLLGFTAYLIE